MTITYSKLSGATFAIGTTTVTVTVKDAANNTSTKTFTVTVRDTTAPVITAPNMTVEASQPSGWKVGTFTTTASDAVGVTSLTFSKSVGTILPFGTTTVTATAKDAAGNIATATFTVTVVDTTAPVLTFVSPNLVIEATSAAGAVVSYAAATATDAAGPITITYTKATGSTFAIGTTTVTVTATDGHGNSSSSSFTVKVQDTTAPTIVAPLYVVFDATSLAGATVTYPLTATDAVGPVTVVYSIPSGTLFPLSFTTVTLTATDAYGNTSTGSFQVFVWDSTPPIVTSVSGNLTHEATGPSGAVVSIRGRDGDRCAPAGPDLVLEGVRLDVRDRHDDRVRHLHRQRGTRRRQVVHREGAGHDGACDHDGEPEPDGRGDLALRRNRELRRGDRDGCRRPGDDHLLEELGLDIRDRDDHRDGHREGRVRQHVHADVHGDGARHDSAGHHHLAAAT